MTSIFLIDMSFSSILEYHGINNLIFFWNLGNLDENKSYFSVISDPAFYLNECKRGQCAHFGFNQNWVLNLNPNKVMLGNFFLLKNNVNSAFGVMQGN